MRKTYRIVALLIAVEVVVQAAAPAWALFGLGKWIDDGNTFNKTMLGAATARGTSPRSAAS